MQQRSPNVRIAEWCGCALPHGHHHFLIPVRFPSPNLLLCPNQSFMSVILIMTYKCQSKHIKKQSLKSLLQHHSSKASVLRCSSFFTVQLSHPYMNTGKTTALTRQTFIDKVMSLLVNMLSRLVITFLPRSKCLNFIAAVTICSDFGPPQNKVSHCFHFFLSICHEVT